MSVTAPHRPAPPRTSGPTLAYRAVLTARGRAGFDAVRSATAAWVTRKHGSAPMASGQHTLNDRATLTNQVIYGPDGKETAIRLQLREESAEATWRTTVTAAENDNLVHAVLALEVFPAPGQRAHPAWPNLARTLTAALRPNDGPAHLTCAAQVIDAYDAAILPDILCDPDRRMPAIIAARPVRADPLWSQRMTRLMPQCAGAASLYLLDDTAAVDAFRHAIGEHHRIAPGSVRTYQPEIDPAWPGDAARHRYVSGTRMTDPADHAWKAIAGAVQRAATAAEIPEALRALAFPDPGAHHREQRHAALATARDSAEINSLRRDVEELRELLTIADQDIREADVEKVLAEASIAALENELADARTLAEASDEDAMWALGELEHAAAQNALLRNRLYAAGRYEDAAADTGEMPGAPVGFEQLWERAAALPRLLITADRATALGLDSHERARVWSAKAWQGLRALDAYAAATAAGFTGGFYEYCRGGRSGAEAAFSANQIAMTESAPTMQAWGDERVFPVPVEVDPDGRATMQPHLRLDRRTTTSPRIHFLDDTKGPTGKVIVGYLGPHLTNTRTN